MFEANMTYDLLPNVDPKTYQEWAKKAIGIVAKQPGMVEFHVNRNVLCSPMVRTTTVFRSLEDWAKFAESEAWHSMEVEMRRFATNMKLEVWGPSPVLPEPVRPASR
jgi:heme-degrading monooxygenase HmoA